MQKYRTRIWIALGVIFGLWVLHRPLVEVLVDWLWFDAVGYSQVFQAHVGAALGLWLGGLVLGFAFVLVNLAFAHREAGLNYGLLSRLLAEGKIPPQSLRSAVKWVLGLGAVFAGLLTGGPLSRQWLDVLTAVHARPFGETDPVFLQDIGFYVFTLPVLELAQSVASALFVITIALTGGFYLLRDVLLKRISLSARAGRHLAVLGGGWFFAIAAGWYLDRYLLLFTNRGAVWGADYADINAGIPSAWVMVGASVLAGVALIAGGLRGSWRPGAVSIAIYVVALVIAKAWPNLLHQYIVTPSELTLEQPYLERNISGTRSAYALDRIDVEPFEAETGLTLADIEARPDTLDNIRIWDDRPLLQTFAQIQEIRLYYDFHDVDIDRYVLDGQIRQVMLSARELNYANVPAQARSWVNEHFSYTHGYGLTVSPVNIVTSEGLPELFVKDIPPSANADLQIDRPEIYYGELTDRYVFVKAGIEEFDYPDGDQNVYTTYAGEGGVPIEGWRKTLFAIYYSSMDILLSQYLKDDSRILMRRTLDERIAEVAPFLSFDRDPYLVVADGRLVWIIDAYTVTNRYPYSEPYGGSFNYIRNAVKVVVDAFDGTVTLYVSDETDPLIQVYGDIFPGALTPMSEMPESIVPHLRYPVGFFDIQARLYASYHMTDTTVFYNREDMWESPKELYGGSAQKMESYYLIMELPGESEAEFILLRPFVPTGKDNMISWLAARCDPEHYGRLLLYQFPKQKLVFGPNQIEARIDQDPEISQQITLWSQSGSSVVRGNLLVIPIEKSLLYVEPLYLKAATGQLPELKRVIVSYEERIAMEPTLEEALEKVFGETVQKTVEVRTEEVVDEETGEMTTVEVEVPAMQQAAEIYAAAIEAQKAGDWAAYGEHITALGELLGASEPE